MTPLAALVALAAIVPLVATLLADRRVGHVRGVLGLAPPVRRSWWAVAAIALVFLFVGVAAAQPVVSGSGPRSEQRTGEVLVVVDTSESMRAGSPPRIERALRAAARLQERVGGVRFGLASMTDRVLPHIFPTLDSDDYRATLRSAVGVDRPPPARRRAAQASGFDELSALGTDRFFVNKGARVAVVLTDGETRAFDPSSVGRALAAARVRVVLVRFWHPGERISGDDAYRADPASGVDLQTLANALDTRVYSEARLTEVAAAVRRDLGSGRAAPPAQRVAGAHPLAPYALLAALVPLGLLVARRNVR